MLSRAATHAMPLISQTTARSLCTESRTFQQTRSNSPSIVGLQPLRLHQAFGNRRLRRERSQIVADQPLVQQLVFVFQARFGSAKDPIGLSEQVLQLGNLPGEFGIV